MRAFTVTFSICAVALASACTEPPGEAPDAGPDAGTRPPAPPPPDLDGAMPPDDGGVALADPVPKALAGGTLAITAAGVIVGADPDRDWIRFTDLSTRLPLGVVEVEPGDAPERVAVVASDDRETVVVALREGGAVAFLDVATRALVGRHAACPAPRGVAADGARVHVACAGGELITLAVPSGVVERTVTLAPDLRDVVVVGTDLYVSRLRAAEVIVVGADGAVREILAPPAEVLSPSMSGPATSNTMRRIVPFAEGVVALSQASLSVDSGPDGGYGRLSEPQLTYLSATDPKGDGTTVTGVLGRYVGGVPMDIACQTEGRQCFLVSTTNVQSVQLLEDGTGLWFANLETAAPGLYTAIAQSEGAVVIAVHDLPGIRISDARGTHTVILGPPAARRPDEGLALFYETPTNDGMACATCHPGGADDGHVWSLGSGPRRTQPLVGGLLDTAPFHWAGDQRDLASIMSTTFTERLMGRRLSDEQVAAIGRFLHAQPATPGSSPDPEATARGRAAFEEAGCNDCHRGPQLTNDETVDVGTGGAFQVPGLLGLSLRAPYLHDGCATELRELFDCGDPDRHGLVSRLDETERADLEAYLRSL